MNKSARMITLAMLTASLLSGCISNSSSLKTGDTKWLFFSEDSASALTDTWIMQHGELRCTGNPRGYLYTEREYTNFKLSLEFQRPAEATKNRGGILLRKTGANQIWPKSLEAQLNAPNAGDLISIGGFRFTSPGPPINTIEHPALGEIIILPGTLDGENPAGSWNRYEVTANGDSVTIRINGTLVNTAIKCDTNPGTICLTSEGDPIKFRNISIINLE